MSIFYARRPTGYLRAGQDFKKVPPENIYLPWGTSSGFALTCS